jgi:hypothetical protein
MAKRGKVKSKRVRAKPSKATPKKRKLSTSPEAKRARARRAEQKHAAELEAKRLTRLRAKRRKQAKVRRAERESIALGEAERKADLRLKKQKRAQGDERQLLIDVLEDMRNVASSIVPMSLEVTEPEVGARIPWLAVGSFPAVDPPSYAELHAVFSAWRDDLFLEAKIHPQRLSQIRIVYNDPRAKRGEADSIVSHTGPWEAVISEITHEVDPDDEDSLSARYSETTVPTFYVYFSGQLASTLEISL